LFIWFPYNAKSFVVQSAPAGAIMFGIFGKSKKNRPEAGQIRSTKSETIQNPKNAVGTAQLTFLSYPTVIVAS